MRTAFLFPGQGSQLAGMGKDIYEKYAAARQVYDTVSARSSVDVAQLSFNGSDGRLKESEHAQIAIFTMSLAIFEILISAGLRPSIVAGHSLGQYSALVACGGLDLKDGISLVQQRGKLMSAACRVYPGAMAAIEGLTVEQVKEICRSSNQGDAVWIANHNTKSQLVISGSKKGVQKALQNAKKEGARTVLLPVSGAFHSPLMEEPSRKLNASIEKILIKNPAFPIIGNAGVKILSHSSEVVSEMMSHMLSPVRWCETVENMLERDVTRFVEVGPGNVLKGLVLRINRKAEVFTTGTVRDIELAMERMLRA